MHNQIIFRKFVRLIDIKLPLSNTIIMERNYIKLFESRHIRTSWDEQQEKWYFSVVDVIEVLTDTDRVSTGAT